MQEETSINEIHISNRFGKNNLRRRHPGPNTGQKWQWLLFLGAKIFEPESKLFIKLLCIDKNSQK